MQITRRHTSTAHDEAGQTIAEYSVLVAGIALVVFFVLPFVGSAVTGLYTGVVNAL
jgi:Flp pilus assembly pilin Flp